MPRPTYDDVAFSSRGEGQAGPALISHHAWDYPDAGSERDLRLDLGAIFGRTDRSARPDAAGLACALVAVLLVLAFVVVARRVGIVAGLATVGALALRHEIDPLIAPLGPAWRDALAAVLVFWAFMAMCRQVETGGRNLLRLGAAAALCGLAADVSLLAGSSIGMVLAGVGYIAVQQQWKTRRALGQLVFAILVFVVLLAPQVRLVSDSDAPGPWTWMRVAAAVDALGSASPAWSTLPRELSRDRGVPLVALGCVLLGLRLKRRVRHPEWLALGAVASSCVAAVVLPAAYVFLPCVAPLVAAAAVAIATAFHPRTSAHPVAPADARRHLAAVATVAVLSCPILWLIGDRESAPADIGPDLAERIAAGIPGSAPAHTKGAIMTESTVATGVALATSRPVVVVPDGAARFAAAAERYGVTVFVVPRERSDVLDVIPGLTRRLDGAWCVAYR